MSPFCWQLNSWITEKLQTASDDSYKDPRNLESKLKKHDGFRAEVTAHEDAINDVKTNGEALISTEHYARVDIAQRLERLCSRWEELLQASRKKGQKLEEARDHLKFNQEADNMELVINDKVVWKWKLIVFSLFNFPRIFASLVGGW